MLVARPRRSDRRPDDTVVDRRIAERFVPSGRGRQRRDAELTLQHRDAGPVLADRSRLIAGRGVQLHQSDVRTLIERVEVEAARCGLDRRGAGRQRLRPPPPGGRGPRGRCGCRRPPPWCGPVRRVRAVTQAEAGQERPPSQARRGGQVRPRSTLGQPLQLDQVDTNAGGVQPDPGALDPQPVLGDGAAQLQGPAQSAVRRGAVGIGPQQGGQLLARIGPAVSRQHDQDGDRLARVDVQRTTIYEDLGRTEESDLQSALVVTTRHARNDTTGDDVPYRRNVLRTLRFDDGGTNRQTEVPGVGPT